MARYEKESEPEADEVEGYRFEGLNEPDDKSVGETAKKIPEEGQLGEEIFKG